MKIKINKEEFLDKLQIVQNIVSQRSTLPILSNYLLETSPDIKKLWITSTNLEIGIKSPVSADIQEEGSITLPAKKLGEILHSFPSNGSSIDIELRLSENNRVFLTGARSRFQVAGLSKEDYPILPDFQKKTVFKIPSNTLVDMIEKTIFAVSADETRYVLNGVLFSVSGQKTCMVATDGRRLATITHQDLNAVSPETSFKIIVPAKALSEVAKIIHHNDLNLNRDILIDVAENQIGFQIDETVLFSRLIEGNFPNWEQVLPKKIEIVAIANCERLLLVTKRAALCITERVGSCRYKLFKNHCLVTSKTSGHYEFEEDVELVDYNGPDGFEVAFNPNYVIDFLKAIKTDSFELLLTTSVNPVLLRPREDATYNYIIMPMKLGSP